MTKTYLHGQVRFPKRMFYLGIGLVCLGLAVSAGYSYIALSQLQERYLDGVGTEVAAAIHRDTRGQGRRSDLTQWQRVLDRTLELYQDRVAFLVLADRSGNLLAAAGEEQSELRRPAELARKRGLYLFNSEVLAPVGPRWDESRGQGDGWNLKIAVYPELAAYLKRQAFLQLLMAGLAIGVMLTISFILIRTLDRFVALKIKEEADRHMAALGRMSAALAHEIRNPLGAMKGLTQVVQEGLPPDHSAQGLMRTVVSEAERLEGLVTDLLEFARPRKLTPCRFDLESLFRDVQGLLKARAEQEGIRIDCSVGPEASQVVADHDALQQILLNVVINAMDASSEGGRVTLESRIDVSSGRLLITVRDEGRGLDGIDGEELFEPFKTTKAHGTGLGLAVSRRLVEALQGEIGLEENSHGGGVTCRIALPQPAVPQTAEPAQGSNEG